MKIVDPVTYDEHIKVTTSVLHTSKLSYIET